MQKKTKIGIGFWGSLFFLEGVAFLIAYETIGATVSALLGVFSFLVNLVVLFIFFRWFWPAALVGIAYLVLVYVCIVPLCVKWYYVDREAKRIVAWVYAEQARTGSYPDDLSGYSFLEPDYEEDISYTKFDYSMGTGPHSGSISFCVTYSVGSENTGHNYDSEHGWFYQDD